MPSQEKSADMVNGWGTPVKNPKRFTAAHLDEGDQRLLLNIRHTLEARDTRIVTTSEILRLGLYELAAKLGIAR